METLKHPIEALRRWLINKERVSIFVAAQKDFEESMQDEIEKRAEKLAKQKLETLLSAIDWDAVVKVDKARGILSIGTDRPDPARLASLKSEAEFLAESDLGKILWETPKALAEKAMFVDGDNLDTMKKGRSILFTLASQKNIIDTFRAYRGDALSPGSNLNITNRV